MSESFPNDHSQYEEVQTGIQKHNCIVDSYIFNYLFDNKLLFGPMYQVIPVDETSPNEVESTIIGENIDF